MKEKNLKEAQIGKNNGVSVANSQLNQQPIILLDEFGKVGTGLTEKQRKRMGYASYNESVPCFVRSKNKELKIWAVGHLLMVVVLVRKQEFSAFRLL